MNKTEKEKLHVDKILKIYEEFTENMWANTGAFGASISSHRAGDQWRNPRIELSTLNEDERAIWNTYAAAWTLMQRGISLYNIDYELSESLTDAWKEKRRAARKAFGKGAQEKRERDARVKALHDISTKQALNATRELVGQLCIHEAHLRENTISRDVVNTTDNLMEKLRSANIGLDKKKKKSK